MKNRTIVLLLLLASFGLRAQMHDGNFGNEWINFSQSYYKMKVVEDGLYRINASALQNAGINVGSLTPGNMQIYSMGQEIPIYVHTNNGVVDYIEFYGKKHRGEMDVNLYNNSSQHFNTEYSAITDTAAYFLTWNTSGNTRQFSNSSANLSNLPSKENYYMHRSVTPLTTGWQKGKEYQISTELLTKGTFEYGEGWGGNKQVDQNIPVSISNLYNAGPSATGSVRIYSAGNTQHDLEIYVSNNILFTSFFGVDSVGLYSFNIPLNLLSATTTVRVRGAGGVNDLHSVSLVDITYPRNFDFGGASAYYFKVAAGPRKYLEINNFNGIGAAAQTIYLYDITNNIRIQCFWDGLRVLTDLPASATDRELVLINQAAPNGIKTIGRLDQVQFTDYSSTNADYIIVAHSKLMTNSQGQNPIIDYAAYRASTGFNPVVVDVQQIFDQFGYGIDMHPVSMRNFATYIKQNWSNPQYLFLIGKARVYNDVRNFNTYDHLIPTFGYPPSDVLLVAPLGSDVPSIPIGRLAATNGDQVSIYLQKIRDVEAQQNAAQTLIDRGWMKNVVHLGGGSDASQQSIIRQNLDDMAAIISGTQYGANVTSFFKTSSNPIQAAQSAFLDSLINSGVSLLTFFGHSSANSFDFNLDRPENYNNYQKYPMFISLGCYGGTIFEDEVKISEKFVFEPDAGAIVFLASVGASALSALNIYANRYYMQTTGVDYGQGAAKMVQSTIETLQNSGGYYTSATVQMACHYMTYHGDPAFNLNTHARPDYYIDETLVHHEPTTVTTQMTDFELVIDVHNIGMAIDTSFFIEINREFPDGQTAFVTRQRVTAPYYHSEVRIIVPVGGQQALGINFFDIEIDSDEEVAETPNPTAEQNNTVIRYPVQIVSDAILPVYPAEFAIVPTQPIPLRASTGNTFAQTQTYRIQIDTTEYFNSPLMQQTTITQPGGVVEWTPTLTYVDSVVYYWRVSIDSTNPTVGFDWAYSSFIFLDGSYPGWNQSHYFQYLKDDFKNMELEEPTRTFEYFTSLQEITLHNGFTPSPLNPELLATYLNGNLIDKCRCHYNKGTYVQVIDSSNLDIWVLPGGTSRYGAINCDGASRDAHVFLFETDLPAKQAAMESFLRDSIPDGFYVLIYTLNDATANAWPSSLTGYLQSQGSTQISTLAGIFGGMPWAFFYQKNNTTFPYKTEALAASTNDVINLSCIIPGGWDSGTLKSRLVGPAQNWYSFHWRTSTPDGLATDNVSVDVYGVLSSGTRVLLMDDLTVLDTIISNIPATTYPYLELIWNSSDETHQSSAQLDYWRVLADLAPDAALRPELYHLTEFDTIQQGQPFRFEVMMQNISLVDMDSMMVKWSLLGQNSEYKRLAELPAGDTLRSSILTVETANLNGPQYLFVEINPFDSLHQREMHHFNNVALVPFYVQGDIVNPLLDVTFDGVRIMNGDIVSGKPQIVVGLSDENRWLGLDDSTDFKLILRHPNFQNGETEIALGNSIVRRLDFLPADAQNLVIENKAQIVMDLDLPWDGTYTLFVSATDKSGNNSGRLDYSVDFDVINTPMISDVLNYPNPFTTQTQFVFTLTGREVPEYLKIQIMTITGKIVREIGIDELGPLHIGMNRTQYAWDGTDQFGDRLANGVYLYRVIAKLNKSDEEDMKLYNTRVSSMFQKGFGKMYLMR